LRANLGDPGADFATFLRLLLDGSPFQRIADLGAHEIVNYPAGGPLDTNPYGLAQAPDGRFLVADASGNDFPAVTGVGAVSTLGVLPSRPNPLPFGPPVFQSVPTSIAVGPDNAYYIGQLTGFPFPPGAANVYRYDPATASLTVAHSGFTNIMDLTFDDEGNFVRPATHHEWAGCSGTRSGGLPGCHYVCGQSRGSASITSGGTARCRGNAFGTGTTIADTEFGGDPSRDEFRIGHFRIVSASGCRSLSNP
jgi:hypothetical protein